MPKVRFSALVTDMKGKANGSVFASNAGGTYFRTNKTGGGRKSVDWATNKNKFADLSSTWRSLTQEQRDAWKDARTLYPTTNAFGQVRIPTSYELYMRLNATLQASGLPTLITPNVPRTMPTTFPINLDNPSYIAFNPQRIANLSTPLKNNARLVAKDINNLTGFWADGIICCRFVLPTNFYNSWINNRIYGLITMWNSVEGGPIVFLKANADGSATLYRTISLKNSSGQRFTYIATYIIPQSDIFTEIHIINRSTTTGDTCGDIFINGALYPIATEGLRNGITNDLQTLANWAENLLPLGQQGVNLGPTLYDCYLGSTADAYYYPFGVSDFRYYDDVVLTLNCDFEYDNATGSVCIEGQLMYRNEIPAQTYATSDTTPEGTCNVFEAPTNGFCVNFNDEKYLYTPVRLMQIYKGYILGNESILVGFEQSVDGAYLNVNGINQDIAFRLTTTPLGGSCTNCNENGFACVDDMCVYTGAYSNVSIKQRITFGPVAILQRLNIPDQNYFYYIIEYSKLVSAGKSIEQIPYVQLGTFPANMSPVNLSKELLRLTGAFPNDGTYVYNAKLLDGSTGMVYNTQIPFEGINSRVRKYQSVQLLTVNTN